MSHSVTYGFQSPLSSNNVMQKSTINGQWAGKSLQIKSILAPTLTTDVCNKFYHDTNSITGLLTTQGDIAVFSDDGGQPKVIRFPAGNNDELIVYDNGVDAGIKSTPDLLNLGDISQTGVLFTEFIEKAGGSGALKIENNILINHTGTTTILQVGDVAAMPTSSNTELNLEGKADASIWIQGDTDGLTPNDSTFLSHTLDQNSLFSGFALSKASGNFSMQTAQDGTTTDPDIIFQVNGSYVPTSNRPVPIDFITAMTIDGTTGEVDIPIITNSLITSAITITQELIYDVTPIGNLKADAGDTATLIVSQCFSGLLMGNPTANAVYTLPTAADIITSRINAAIGQHFTMTIFNISGTFTIDMKISTGMTSLTGLIIGGIIAVIGTQKTVVLKFIFTNVSIGTESLDIFRVEN